MKNILPLILVIALCSLYGCRRIPPGIEYIMVCKKSFNGVAPQADTCVDSYKITDKDRIADIAGAINSSHSEPAKFFPEYDMGVCYKDATIRIAVIGNYFMINGRSFRSDKDLARIMKNSRH